MPITRLPVTLLTTPPAEFKTLSEANIYLRNLHRDLENALLKIDEIISVNYNDIDGGTP